MWHLVSHAMSLRLLANPERRAGSVNAMYDRQYAGSHGSNRHGAQTNRAQYELRITNGRLLKVVAAEEFVNPHAGLVSKFSWLQDIRRKVSSEFHLPLQRHKAKILPPELGKGPTGYKAVRASNDGPSQILPLVRVEPK